MKQGSADDPFAEEPADGEGEDAGDESADPEPDGAAEPALGADDRTGERAVREGEPATGPTDDATTAEPRGESAGAADGQSRSDREPAGQSRSDPDGQGGQPASTGAAESGRRQSLPYIHARDGVKDGRTQRPVFLRDHVESGIDELVAEMEAALGEDVYKTDVTEAAMAVAQENPDLVRAKLEEWGYGWT